MDGSAWWGASARPYLWVGSWPAVTGNRPGWSGHCPAEMPACFSEEHDIVSAGFSHAAEAPSPAARPSCLQSLLLVSVPPKKPPEGWGRGQGGTTVCRLLGRHLSVFALTTQHMSQNKRRDPGFTLRPASPGRSPHAAGARGLRVADQAGLPALPTTRE